MTNNHFFLIKKPKARAFMKAGRKSRPRNTGGFPRPIAKKVPITMLKAPTYGPNRIPYNGAIVSAKEKRPVIPTIGKVGSKRRIRYITEKTDIKAIFLFERLPRVKRNTMVNR